MSFMRTFWIIRFAMEHQLAVFNAMQQQQAQQAQQPSAQQVDPHGGHHHQGAPQPGMMAPWFHPGAMQGQVPHPFFSQFQPQAPVIYMQPQPLPRRRRSQESEEESLGSEGVTLPTRKRRLGSVPSDELLFSRSQTTMGGVGPRVVPIRERKKAIEACNPSCTLLRMVTLGCKGTDCMMFWFSGIGPTLRRNELGLRTRACLRKLAKAEYLERGEPGKNIQFPLTEAFVYNKALESGWNISWNQIYEVAAASLTPVLPCLQPGIAPTLVLPCQQQAAASSNMAVSSLGSDDFQMRMQGAMQAFMQPIQPQLRPFKQAGSPSERGVDTTSSGVVTPPRPTMHRANSFLELNAAQSIEAAAVPGEGLHDADEDLQHDLKAADETFGGSDECIDDLINQAHGRANRVLFSVNDADDVADCA